MEMTIGTNIKRLRTAKGITQEQLSLAMNVTCAAVSKWERSETYPDITTTSTSTAMVPNEPSPIIASLSSEPHCSQTS